MKKICFIFNQLSIANGVAKSAIAFANLLSSLEDIEVTLKPLYRCDTQIVKNGISPKVKVEPVFGFYFAGFAKLLHFFPHRLLYRYAIRKQYDIEIAFQYGISTEIIAYSSNKKAKHYAWMHGYDYGLKLRRYYLMMDKVVCVSRSNAERLSIEINNNIPVDYCYNPINEKEIQDRGNEAIPDINSGEGLILVTVGRMSEEKGYDRLLDCLERLKGEGYKFRMWFIGGGQLLNALTEKAKALNIHNIVSFMGTQSNPHKYTSKADLFLCSSFSEGYSTACTEAIMLGVPVLSTNVSGAKEIIDDSGAGMVVGMDDNSLYNGIKYVLDHQKLIKKWKGTIQITRQKFYQEKCRKTKLLKVLDIQNSTSTLSSHKL